VGGGGEEDHPGLNLKAIWPKAGEMGLFVRKQTLEHGEF
jgi:hypothetical protein